MRKQKTLLFVTAVFLIAGCDAHTSVESVVPREVAAARIDSDAALARKVEKALGVDEGNLPYGVEVTATGGKVELWGKVDSNAARKRFGVIAAGVVGVRAIENHIEVDPGA
jgi:osmotically-inducible protein OsmY